MLNVLKFDYKEQTSTKSRREYLRKQMLNFHLNYNLNVISCNCSIAQRSEYRTHKQKILCISLVLVIKATAVATFKKKEERTKRKKSQCSGKKSEHQTNIAFRLLIIRILSIAIVSNVTRIYDTSTTAEQIYVYS